MLSRLILILRWIKSKLDLGRLYSRLDKRERALACYSQKNTSEEARLSYVLGMSKVISSLLLCLLLIMTLIFGVGVVSYDNVYYMLKDISYIKSFDEGAPESLSYSRPMQNQVFGKFKNGLMAVGDSEIKLFTSTGRVTLSEGSEFVDPHVAVSDRHVLIYDLGRDQFSVYNSFVKLYSENTDYRISCADMAKNGCFATVTGSKEYASVVRVYDERFELICTYNKNSHVVSVSLSSNGRYAAILSVDALNGKAISELSLIDCKRSKLISSESFEGSMPYRCEYITDDRIAVFLDDKVITANSKGSVLHQYDYSSNAERIEVSGDSFAIFFSGGSQGEGSLEIFDKEGKRSFARAISGSVSDIKLSDKYVYILQGRELIRINRALGTESACVSSKDASSVVVLDDEKVLLCSQSSAVYISFE